MVDFSSAEWAIIHVMTRHPNTWFTVNRLSNITRMSWERAEEALKSLHRRGYVKMGRSRSRVYWKLY